MNNASFVSVFVERYNRIPATAFGGTTRPPIHLDEAPAADAQGNQLRPPYVVLKDSGFRPEHDSSFGGIERGEITLEVFALKLSDTTADAVTVDSIVQAIKFGGGSAPQNRRGMDFGEVADMGFNYHIQMTRTFERRGYAGWDYQGQRCHKGELRYAVIIGLRPK